MKAVLDQALAEIASGLRGLRAVVLSAAPDGLIAWSWAADGEHDVALGFAALDRAATACLTSLGATDESRSLLLTAHNCWVVSWPLFEGQGAGGQRLVVTIVFGGEELQAGMVMVYGNRVRAHLREVLHEVRSEQVIGLRRSLVRYLAGSTDTSEALRALANASEVELHRLACLEQLPTHSRERLAAYLAQAERSPARLLQ